MTLFDKVTVGTYGYCRQNEVFYRNCFNLCHCPEIVKIPCRVGDVGDSKESRCHDQAYPQDLEW